MLYVLWGVSLLGTLFLSITKNKSKNLHRIAMLGLFLFFWILLGWSSGAYDVEIGISRYVNYQKFESFTEIGYNFLVILGHRIGLSYRQFFIICSFFEIAVMFWFVQKNSVKSSLVFFLFLIFPMVVYFQYIRNILAFSFVLIGLDSLINKKKAYIVKYVIFIILGATIHFNSIFFLLYLPFSFIKKRVALLITFIAFLLLYSLSSIDFLANILMEFLGEAKVDIVLGSANDATGTFGRIFALTFSILEFFVIYFFLKSFFKVPMDDEYTKIFFNINLLSFLFIPLTLNFGVGFARIPTLLAIFNYTFFVNKISLLKKQENRIFLYIVLILFLLGLFILNFRNLEYRQLTLYPFFENNELINWIVG